MSRKAWEAREPSEPELERVPHLDGGTSSEWGVTHGWARHGSLGCDPPPHDRWSWSLRVEIIAVRRWRWTEILKAKPVTVHTPESPREPSGRSRTC